MAAHARLKNEFTEGEKCQNLMGWLKYSRHPLNDKVTRAVFASDKSPPIKLFNLLECIG